MTYTHGLSGTRAYKSWHTMVYRCTSPKATHYERYGGRGITVCEHWRDFLNFYADMGERPSLKHSIDRRDNDGGYWCGHCAECRRYGWPPNCHWATKAEQSRNSSSRKLTRADVDWIRSRPHSIAQMARMLGVSSCTVSRIANGLKWVAA